MLGATCHCQKIAVSVDRLPAYLNECHCDVCRRYAARWAYYTLAEVTFGFDPELDVDTYVCNDRVLDFYRCIECGCVSHWREKDGERVAINARLFEPAEIAAIEVRVSEGPD
jgi:hypothetical protein